MRTMSTVVKKKLTFRAAKKVAAEGPHAVQGITRMGRVGVGIFHQGKMTGWGGSETAAWASHQQHVASQVNKSARFASGTSVGKRDVSKGILTQGTKPVLARRTPAIVTNALSKAPQPPRRIIGKSAVGEGLKVMRAAPKVARAGFKMGATGASKPKLPLGAATALHGSKGLQKIGSASKWAAENRGAVGLSTGIVSGSVLGAGLARRDDVEKAHGDPDDARYYRLGAGSAVLGAAGAGGLAYAGRDIKTSTKLARSGSPGAVHNFQNKILFSVDREEAEKAKLGRSVKGTILNPRLVKQSERLARNGFGFTRRGALAGAGGLAALGGAEALRRKAHERRWN